MVNPLLSSEERLQYLEQLSKRFVLAPAYPNTKVPIGKNWNNPDPHQPFNRTDYIGNNAVIVTGKPSDLFVVDVDNVELFSFLIKKLNVEIPKTFKVKTGSGKFHIYFNYPKDGKDYRKKKKKVLGVDLMGDGGCVVSPKSIHPDTKQSYEVIENILPVDPPQWLIDLYWDNRAAWKNVDVRTSKHISNEIKELIINNAEKGKRSEAMMSVIDSLVSKGFSDEQIFYTFYSYSIGEKFISVGDTRDEWLSKQIEKARSYVSTNQGLLELLESDKDEYYNSIINNIDVGFGEKFIQAAPPKVAPIIEGILPQKGCLVIIGPPGIGKSLFTLNISMHMGNPPAKGIFELLNVPKPVKSVFLQSENDQYSLWNRVRTITSADPGMKSGYRNVFIPSFNGRSRCIGFVFRSEYFRKLLMTLKQKTGAQVAIIDPAISFMGAEENSNSEIRASLDSLTRVATDADMSVILVHHPGKVGNMGVYTGRGASALADWASNLMTMNIVSMNNTKCVKITIEKSRTSAVIDPFHIMLNENLIFKKYEPHVGMVSTIIQVLLQNGGTISTQAGLLDAIKQYDSNISVSGVKKAIEQAAEQKLIRITVGSKNSKSFSII